MASIIAAVGAWLKSKLGAVLGAILLYLLNKAWAAVQFAWNTYTYWREREKRQKEALEKVEADIESGAGRTEDVKKREEEWLNS